MLKKIILLGLTAVLMTACGSNDSSGASSSRGSGECVDVASFEDSVGLTERNKFTNYHEGKVSNTVVQVVESISFTKNSSKSILYDDKENMQATLESEHSISSNGILRITKFKMDFVSGSPLPDQEEIYDPYEPKSYKIGKNCEGDTWEGEYTSYTKVKGEEKSEGTKNHIKYTIEEVNVEITVTAGTFNAVKIRTVFLPDSNGYTYIWRDTDTGYIVLSESYDGNDKLTQKVETLDIY